MTKDATVAAIAAILAITGMVFYVSGGLTGMATDNGIATDTDMATDNGIATDNGLDPHALRIPEQVEWRSVRIPLPQIEPPTLYQTEEVVGDTAINFCQDSDNGITPAIAGSVTMYIPGVGNVAYSDACVSGLVGVGEESSAYVREYYCVSIGTYTRMFSNFIPCEMGCVDGACR